VLFRSPKEDITYILTVTGEGGCVSTDEVNVISLKMLKIPNTFSPNNDGINDTWQIGNLYIYPYAKIQVFTRTGQLIYQTNGYYKPWDGTKAGKPLPSDTYYYIIEPGESRKPITGYITIMK
jgi:gliding motility-associated-like protein